MVTVRSLNDVKQIGTEFDLLGVRVEFLARPNREQDHGFAEGFFTFGYGAEGPREKFLGALVHQLRGCSDSGPTPAEATITAAEPN